MKFSNLVDHWNGLNSSILSWNSGGKLNFELTDVIDGCFSWGWQYIRNAASMILTVHITDPVALDRPLNHMIIWKFDKS